MKIPYFRYRSPMYQNVMSGCGIGAAGGLYTALNLLGAGGGRPDNAHVVQVVNCMLCAIWAVSSWFGGTFVNKFGPAISSFFGLLGYILYVGSLWYYDSTGLTGFPYFAGVAIGISAGLVFCTSGYIIIGYAEEREKGYFAAVAMNLLAFFTVIGTLIALIINRDATTAAGVPPAVYIVLMVIMVIVMVLQLTILPPSKCVRKDGSVVNTFKARGLLEEFKLNLSGLRDYRVLCLIPGFVISECFLVYSGSVNAFHNNLRTRSLLAFCAVVIQIPFGFLLSYFVLDNARFQRKTRAFMAVLVVGVPLIGSWIWEVVRVSKYDRSNPPVPMDWTDGNFAAIFILFNLTWCTSALFQYVIIWFLGALTNDARKGAYYIGLYRGFLGAGEAVVFGLDSSSIAYVKEAAIIFSFYTAGVLIFLFAAWKWVDNTTYFKEEFVVVPNHVLLETGHAQEVKGMSPTDDTEGSATPPTMEPKA